MKVPVHKCETSGGKSTINRDKAARSANRKWAVRTRWLTGQSASQIAPSTALNLERADGQTQIYYYYCCCCNCYHILETNFGRILTKVYENKVVDLWKMFSLMKKWNVSISLSFASERGQKIETLYIYKKKYRAASLPFYRISLIIHYYFIFYVFFTLFCDCKLTNFGLNPSVSSLALTLLFTTTSFQLFERQWWCNNMSLKLRGRVRVSLDAG